MKKNRILVINPNWNAYSETWLHRMMSYVEDEIVGLACFNPSDKYWKGKNVFNLELQFSQKKLINKIGLNLFSIFILNKSCISPFERFLNKVSPNIIWINFIGPALYLKDILATIDIPIVIHIHGVDVFIDAQSEQSGYKIHPTNYQYLVRDFSKRKNIYFIANSKFTFSLLDRFEIDNSKIFLKYFGVDIQADEIEKNNDNLEVLFVGRFVDFKGPDKVLESFYLACDLGFRGTLTMAGDGPLKPMCLLLNSRSKYTNRVNFRDPLPPLEITKLMMNADIFTMHNCYGTNSKQYEAFGVVIIEAMSFGLPVITGNSGGVNEIIEKDADGILVESLDIHSHAKALLKLQNDISFRKHISKNARRKIYSKFNSKQESLRLKAIFNKVTV